MSGRFNRLVSAWLVVSLTACSTLRPVPGWTDGTAAAGPERTQAVHAGDRVRVTTSGAAPLDLVITSVETDALVGTAAGQAAPVRVPFDQVVRIERQESDPAKTTWLTIGVGALVLVGLLAVALSHMAFFPGPP